MSSETSQGAATVVLVTSWFIAYKDFNLTSHVMLLSVVYGTLHKNVCELAAICSKFRVRCKIVNRIAKVASLRLAHGELFVNHDNYAQFLKESCKATNNTHVYVCN